MSLFEGSAFASNNLACLVGTDRAPAEEDLPISDEQILRIVEGVACQLREDKSTDWAKVNLGGLRQHLLDMKTVALRATATAQAIEGGVRATFRGEAETIDPIQRAVPAEARALAREQGLYTSIQLNADGVTINMTADDQAVADMLQALGSVAIFSSGPEHRNFHLAIARGETAY